MTIFRTNYRALSIAAEQKLKPKIGHLLFEPCTFFLNIRFADAIQRLQHFGAGATTCKPAPHRDAVLVVINIDETNVKLVPQERVGHVSKRAYRLFVRGRLMIRRWRRSQ